MKVYLAARYSEKEQIKKYAEELREAGIEITSSWLEEPHAAGTQMFEIPPELATEYAKQDVNDIRDADLLIFFSKDPTFATVRGGRHVEFGIAFALGKPILVVGPQENIFHYIETVCNLPTWEHVKAVCFLMQMLTTN